MTANGWDADIAAKASSQCLHDCAKKVYDTFHDVPLPFPPWESN